MSRRLTKEEILNRLNKLYNGRFKYDLNIDPNSVHDKIKVNCKIHGESDIRIWDHLNGTICKKCAFESSRKIQHIGNEEFIKKSIEKHGSNTFDYSNLNYLNNRTKVNLICKIHNQSFSQNPRQHLAGNVSCPMYSKVISVGEFTIREYLNTRNFQFIEQHSFSDCRNKKILKFDFYLPNQNTIIEYDGRQHFQIGWNSESEFKRTQENDKIKNEYYKSNGIRLIRIPSSDFKNIDKILNNEL